uniref:Tyrosine specific protein phosphatases domain-containing protein n=1 Tax=Knufia peltigerae TaxID=1002370 RepID=A0AA39CW78_9EURO|nr:hypothetical protein H2204_008157 [Knufia peltigerae]
MSSGSPAPLSSICRHGVEFALPAGDADSRPTAARHSVLVHELQSQEFTCLCPSRCAATAAVDRAQWVEDYWERCEPQYIDGPGAESFSSLVQRGDTAPYPKVYDVMAIDQETRAWVLNRNGRLHVKTSDDGVGIDEVMTVVSGDPFTWMFVLPDGVLARLTVLEINPAGPAIRLSYPGLGMHAGYMDPARGLIVAYAHGPESFTIRFEESAVTHSALQNTNDWVDFSNEMPTLRSKRTARGMAPTYRSLGDSPAVACVRPRNMHPKTWRGWNCASPPPGTLARRLVPMSNVAWILSQELGDSELLPALSQVLAAPLGSRLDIQFKSGQRLLLALSGNRFRRAQVSRTSVSHPLQIATLPVGMNGGGIGVTFAPGKHQEVAMTGAWARDLDVDLASIVRWGAQHLITLIEPWEFQELRISSLAECAHAHGLKWHGLPITDGAAPDARLLEPWKSLGPQLAAELLSGSRIVVHCKGGLGRAGTVASMLLIETGCASDGTDAIAKVRSVRPGAVETPEQEEFILNWPDRRAPRER